MAQVWRQGLRKRKKGSSLEGSLNENFVESRANGVGGGRECALTWNYLKDMAIGVGQGCRDPEEGCRVWADPEPRAFFWGLL